MTATGDLRVIDSEVAVVGAGPAGSALAVHLARRGIGVVLMDRGPAPAFRVGETLPPGVAKRLRRLGVWADFLALDPLPQHGVMSVWGEADAAVHSYFGSTDACGWRVDRAAFDALLREAARRAGATLVTSVPAPAWERTAAGNWRLRGKPASGPVEVRAAVVVDATGRTAAVARSQGARLRRVDALVGVTWRLERGAAVEEQPTLVEATPGGWWYTTDVPRGQTVAVFVTDADECAARRLTRAASWPAALADAPHTTRRLHDRPRPAAARAFPCSTHALEPAGGDGWLAVGDAAVGRDPVSGSGVDFALASAELAAQAVLARRAGAGDAFSVYADLLRRDFAAYLSERRAYYAVERRWPGARFWQRRLAAC